MTTRKPRTRAASRAAKTIDLTAEDVTKREQSDRTEPESVKDRPTGSQAAGNKEAPVSDESAEIAQDLSGDDKSVSAKPEDGDAQMAAETEDPSKTVADEKHAPMDEGRFDTTPENSSRGNGASSDTESAGVSEQAAAVPVSELSKKGALGNGLSGGLLGGVAVVALVYAGLQQGWISLPVSQERQEEQAAVIDRLDSGLSDLRQQFSNVPTLDIPSIEARIGDLEGEIASANGKMEELTGKLENRLGAIGNADDLSKSGSTELAENGNRQSAGGVVGPLGSGNESVVARLEDLSRRLDDLEVLRERFAGTREKLTQLEAQALAQTALIETRATEQAGKLEADLRAAKDSILSSADRRINDVVTDLSNIGAKLSAKTGELADRIASLEKNNLSEKMQSSARSIALTSLENAVESGAGFQPELRTFANVVGDNGSVAILSEYAGSGVPTQRQLGEAFRSVYDGVLREAQEAGAATLMDRFLLNARNLVRVRSLDGEKKGESLTNKLGIIEFHVREGNLEKAVSEWDALPDAARNAEAGADWIRSLKARVAVDKAMETIRAEFGTDTLKTAN